MGVLSVAVGLLISLAVVKSADSANGLPLAHAMVDRGIQHGPIPPRTRPKQAYMCDTSKILSLMNQGADLEAMNILTRTVYGLYQLEAIDRIRESDLIEWDSIRIALVGKYMEMAPAQAADESEITEYVDMILGWTASGPSVVLGNDYEMNFSEEVIRNGIEASPFSRSPYNSYTVHRVYIERLSTFISGLVSELFKMAQTIEKTPRRNLSVLSRSKIDEDVLSLARRFPENLPLLSEIDYDEQSLIQNFPNFSSSQLRSIKSAVIRWERKVREEGHVRSQWNLKLRNLELCATDSSIRCWLDAAYELFTVLETPSPEIDVYKPEIYIRLLKSAGFFLNPHAPDDLMPTGPGGGDHNQIIEYGMSDENLRQRVANYGMVPVFIRAISSLFADTTAII
jgi:hypothetical protein